MRRTLKTVEQEMGNLQEIIPSLVNKHGQVGAAKELMLSPATINGWLRDNHYRKVVRYEKVQA